MSEHSATSDATSYLAYCRPGYEAEAAQELSDHAAQQHIRSDANIDPGSGWLQFHPHERWSVPHWRTLCFSRQLLPLVAHWADLPTQDRLSPVLAAWERQRHPIQDIWVETADTAHGKQLKNLSRALEAAALARLRKDLDPNGRWRLHLFLASGRDLTLCLANTQLACGWRMGIPRLKFPPTAPSRSTLKLDEAFMTLLDERERVRWLRAGMQAVDLGAAPGGWTYQLVRRAIRVICVDNGRLDAGLLQSGLVTHQRADGFRYQPRRSVDWMVCDMVEQPARVAALMLRWFEQGWCRYCIFNLKLPMKKRYAEVNHCLDLLRAAKRIDIELRTKQLYHDRDEVTVFARRREGR